MDVNRWRYVAGKEAVQTLCAELGITPKMFNHLANKHKRPSADRARAMVAISARLTPSTPMTFDALLFPLAELRTPPRKEAR